jgi:ubiquinone/menaquinone biosynthesis C-methylase UbiE
MVIEAGAQDAKAASIRQWTADPCGPDASDAVGLLAGRRAYAPWMADALDYRGAVGLDVLDVGCGQGIDLCEFAMAGATVTGIDLTPRHVELAHQHLYELGLDGRVVEGDAEDLPFPDRAFDRVCSNGVLHHTPDMPRALQEIRRVLRPSGYATVVVYNRDSAHYWVKQVLHYGVLRGQLLREHRMANVLSANVERSSIRARPLVRVYSHAALRRLFLQAGFVNVSVRASPLQPSEAFPTWHLLRRTHGFLGRIRLGWYLIVQARP